MAVRNFPVPEGVTRAESMAISPKLRFIATFADPEMPFVVISTLCGGLTAAGNHVVMEWQGDPKGQYWLTVSVVAED